MLLPGQIELQAEGLWSLMPRNEKNIAEAVRRNQTASCSLMLKHNVGRNGGPMHKVVDVTRRYAGMRAYLGDRVERAARGVRGSRRHLVQEDAPVAVVDHDEIGMRTPDINSNPWHRSVCSNLSSLLRQAGHFRDPPCHHRISPTARGKVRVSSGMNPIANSTSISSARNGSTAIATRSSDTFAIGATT